MKKIYILLFIAGSIAILSSSFKRAARNLYRSGYSQKIDEFRHQASILHQAIQINDLQTKEGVRKINTELNKTRDKLMQIDFWLRYLEPIAYKKINGPLPVEWETEVFEKFEKPYKREGAGLTLAALYLGNKKLSKDSLQALVESTIEATNTFEADSITGNLKTFDHFYLCNRLFLLNLASIYTTGYECPDSSRIIPELRSIIANVASIYNSFNQAFPEQSLSPAYKETYKQMIEFVDNQPGDFSAFDHFEFIRNYVNPLFRLNQIAIATNHVRSNSFMDYTLSKNSTSIFSKELYNGQNVKGVYLRVQDENELAEIGRIGKLLFYDPIMSGNNKRSCASCHKPSEFFTDTSRQTSMQYDLAGFLPRNTPTLLNVKFNHLLMLDGLHISLEDQTRAVITNPLEMGSEEKNLMKKILSCAEYRTAFKRFAKLTPQEPELTFDHIVSAITFYYSKFSNFYSPFDEAMNSQGTVTPEVRKGFNLFMSKAQCGTCHFVPQFNGVKPPFTGSEFEVIGVPEDSSFRQISMDKGRYNVNPASEMMNAFRTGSLRNTDRTAPFMHNGIFRTLGEVIDFYDVGGGAGKGMRISNQTLSSDSLHLTKVEKLELLEFLHYLNETVPIENAPERLPVSSNKSLNARKTGGEY